MRGGAGLTLDNNDYITKLGIVDLAKGEAINVERCDRCDNPAERKVGEHRYCRDCYFEQLERG